MIRIVAKGKPWEMTGGLRNRILPTLSDAQIFDEEGRDISASFVGPIEIIIQAGEPIAAKMTAVVAEIDIEAVEVPE